MNFQIGGKRYEVAREDVSNATRNTLRPQLLTVGTSIL